MSGSRCCAERLLRALLCALLLALPISALAAQPEETFEERLREAIALYNARRYDAAIRRFQAAHAITPLPNLLFNIAQCHRKLGHSAQAVTAYQRYLRADPRPPADVLADINKYLDEAQARKRVVRAPRPAPPAAPEVVITPAAAPRPPPDLRAPLAVEPAGVLAAPRPAPAPLHRRWWFWTALSVAAVGVAAGTTALLLTQRSGAPEPQVDPTYDLFRP